MNMCMSFALVTLSAIPSLQGSPVPDPQPMVMVAKFNMPQELPSIISDVQTSQINKDQAVVMYHSIKNCFHLSNTTMAEWLGVKRRTLYNWLNHPEKSRQYGRQIEERLAALATLKDEMEPEHHKFLYKIAFSPIYGHPDFGITILEGASSAALTTWYDELFSHFESYRHVSSKNHTLA